MNVSDAFRARKLPSSSKLLRVKRLNHLRVSHRFRGSVLPEARASFSFSKDCANYRVKLRRTVNISNCRDYSRSPKRLVDVKQSVYSVFWIIRTIIWIYGYDGWDGVLQRKALHHASEHDSRKRDFALDICEPNRSWTGCVKLIFNV